MRDAPIETVLFDLDGTLIDHFRAIYRCYCHALEQLGLEPVSYEKVKAAVGGGIRVTFSRLVPPEYVEEGVRLWRERFDEIWHEEIEVLSGVPELLGQLHREGRKLAILTNKEGEAARKIADHLGWKTFALVSGRLDTQWTKPAGELTRHIVDSLEADPATTVMIGDSPFDVKAGKAGGLRTFVVASGSHSMKELSELGADGVFPDMGTLAREVFGSGSEAPPADN